MTFQPEKKKKFKLIFHDINSVTKTGTIRFILSIHTQTHSGSI